MERVPRELRHLRERLASASDSLTFADLPEDVLEDLAAGWSEGRTLAAHAAELCHRLDGIPLHRREQQISGRATLTLLGRRGLAVAMDVPSDEVTLLGNAALDRGDSDGELAWELRQSQLAKLRELSVPYAPEEYASDLRGALDAARTRGGELEILGIETDEIARSHPFALLAQSLPAGLRVWFHEEYEPDRADALAWKFVLVGRALARHMDRMRTDGVLEVGDAPPARLVAAVLATDLGELAETAILSR